MKSRKHAKSLKNMAHLSGFEPPTNAFGGHYSIQLSYRCVEAAILLTSPLFVHDFLSFNSVEQAIH